MDLGYIIIEYNQASGQPGVVADLMDLDEAKQAIGSWREQAARTGRRETYAIAAVPNLRTAHPTGITTKRGTFSPGTGTR